MLDKNLPLLVQLACDGYNRALPEADGTRGDFQPVIRPGGTVVETYCNLFIQSILSGFRLLEMGGLNANQMVVYMSSRDSWKIVPDEAAAQNLANSGAIVVAGVTSATGHGHVALVLPGSLTYSMSFNRMVPNLANVGRDVFIGKRLSFAFKADDRPKYFVPAPMA